MTRDVPAELRARAEKARRGSWKAERFTRQEWTFKRAWLGAAEAFDEAASLVESAARVESADVRTLRLYFGLHPDSNGDSRIAPTILGARLDPADLERLEALGGYLADPEDKHGEYGDEQIKDGQAILRIVEAVAALELAS